jgi:hypothetical protein
VVVAVVLTWNGREDTLACLASLESAPDRPDAIVVVDNGSSDGTAKAVRERFPGADLVRSDKNLGFAGGNNLGLARARELGADHVLVLNNDTEVEPGAVQALVEEADRRPDAGSLGSKILFAEPPDLIWFAGARFDPRAGYNGRQLGYREHDDGRFDGVHETDRACGAAMLVPRPVLDDGCSSTPRTSSGRCARVARATVTTSFRRASSDTGSPPPAAGRARRSRSTTACGTRSWSASATRRSARSGRGGAGSSCSGRTSCRRSARRGGRPACARCWTDSETGSADGSARAAVSLRGHVARRRQAPGRTRRPHRPRPSPRPRGGDD